MSSCEIKKYLLFVEQERRKQLAARKKRNSDKAKRKPASENFLHQASSKEKPVSRNSTDYGILTTYTERSQGNETRRIRNKET